MARDADTTRPPSPATEHQRDNPTTSLDLRTAEPLDSTTTTRLLTSDLRKSLEEEEDRPQGDHPRDQLQRADHQCRRDAQHQREDAQLLKNQHTEEKAHPSHTRELDSSPRGPLMTTMPQSAEVDITEMVRLRWGIMSCIDMIPLFR